MRKIRAIPLARRNLPSYLVELNRTEPKKWRSELLIRAWNIVAEELDKPDAAREIVLEAVTAAHRCAVEISAAAHSNARSEARRAVLVACSRIAKCIKRLPTKIRHALNRAAANGFRDGDADLEEAPEFFEACNRVLRRYPTQIDAQRIRKALGVPTKIEKTKEKKSATQTLFLIGDYEALHPIERSNVEAALQGVVDTRSELKASEIFVAIASSLRRTSPTKARRSAADSLITYAREVAAIWRAQKLKAGRATKEKRREYRSRFHRFVELVLLDHVDPRSRLFSPPTDEALESAWNFYRNLPDEWRRVTRVGARIEWLISEHHIKLALGRSKNPVKNSIT